MRRERTVRDAGEARGTDGTDAACFERPASPFGLCFHRGGRGEALPGEKEAVAEQAVEETGLV